MKRLAHNITFRDLVEIRIQQIFEEWEEWPDRPKPYIPHIPPSGTLPNARKYELDCQLFKGTQIGILVDKGYKRAYVKARIKDLITFRNKEGETAFKVFEFGDYVRFEVLEHYDDPETGERMTR